MGIASAPRTFLRIPVGLALVASLIWLPIWVTGIIAFLDALVLDAWPEVLAVGFLADAVLGSSFSRLGDFRHVLWSAGIVVLTQGVRYQTRVMYGFS